MEEVRRTVSFAEKIPVDPNPLNSPEEIIIKKENFGLESFQQQNYQYSLLNTLINRDEYYEDVAKMRDRLQKPVPNMQQVIHIDMKRMKINRIYERQLEREVDGPRGLHWQHKQALQRLQNDERNVARHLCRLKREIPHLTVVECSAEEQKQSKKHRSFSIDSSKSEKKRVFLSKSTHWNEKVSPTNFVSMDEEEFQRYQHAQIIAQQQREIEQKLKEFLH